MKGKRWKWDEQIAVKQKDTDREKEKKEGESHWVGKIKNEWNSSNAMKGRLNQCV